MADVEKQLHAARQKLLDLTMRNQLINFRPSKARTIRIIDEIPTEIYDIIVLNESSMGFLPREKEQAELNYNGTDNHHVDEVDDRTESQTENDDAILWEFPSPDAEVADRHLDRYLQTSLEGEFLQKRLFYIYQQSRSVLEEQGYTILYLVLGFLEWRESPTSEQFRRAPIILIPVELIRKQVGKAFKLHWTGEDIFTNISLQAILLEQGIGFPALEMPEDKKDIDRYLQSVVESVSEMSNWSVINDIYLGFFSFTKFVMYRDIDPKVWPEGSSPAQHPLIRAIFDPSPKGSSEKGFNENDIDSKLKTRDLYHIEDADPSQIAVIEDVKNNKNLVVEGPPGTGKSQTITNIIAELLAMGKNVLFVSEKMAALEVVKRRLDKAGLGDFCLELHSRKSRKKEVLGELERTAYKTAHEKGIMSHEFEQLDMMKFELNAYAKALRDPFGIIGYSPYYLFGLKEKVRRHFSEVERQMLNITIENPQNCDKQMYSTAITHLKNLTELLRIITPILAHPWLGCEPGQILPADEKEIEKVLVECIGSLKLLGEEIKYLVDASGVSKPTTMNELELSIDAAKIIAISKPIDKKVLLNEEWNEKNQQVEIIIKKLQRLQSLSSKLLLCFHAKAISKNYEPQLKEFQGLSEKRLRFLNKKYRHLKQKLSNLYKKKAPNNPRKIINDFNKVVKCFRLRIYIRRIEKNGIALFGSHWNGEKSDSDVLKKFSTWMLSFRHQLIKNALSKNAIELVSSGISKTTIEGAYKDIIAEAKRFAKHYNCLMQMINPDMNKIFRKNIKNVPLGEIFSRLELWKGNLSKLQHWSQYIALRNLCDKTIARSIIEVIEGGELLTDDVICCFEGNFADSLLRLVFQERPDLANFIGSVHEKKILNFIELDQKLLNLNQQRLLSKLFKNKPSIAAGASPGSEAGILLGEFNKKRRHMPIRKLMINASGLIQKIKPCFMMSPISIAQYLDPRTVRFDTIIFDEASQVRPEDALGALLRGKKIVVMGDTRQLPPTTFFDRIVDASDEEEEQIETSVSDIESILHLCRLSFPTKTLRWHYRSKHESLIAVSNQEFYDNNLLIYPSPFDKSSNLGLEFVHLSDTVYDRGWSSVNRKEAKAVAQAAADHYKQDTKKSLGIGAFNIKQQQAILEEIELQIRQNPEIEGSFTANQKEPFFVKNLETIQGDERDVILISIGFGFDANRHLTLNFGPLNQDGGERRLNVLITRAKEKCIVFANFKASDLSIGSNSAFGLRALKTFLEYAKNRNLESAEPIGGETESPFEDSVYEFLRKYGFEVRKQIGCAGFRIDLAVVDPEAPGRYLIGIECDGAKYHSSTVARDRDRLRQQILERRRWKIHRIWSTDWYRNRVETEKYLITVIENAKVGIVKRVFTSGDEIQRNDKQFSQTDLHVDAQTIDETQGDDFYQKISNYKVCTSLGIPIYGQLHEYPTKDLSQAIVNIVEIESPVHFDEVIRRIRTLWGLKRSGQRISAAVMRAVSFARDTGQVRQSGDFLLSKRNKDIAARRRSEIPPPKIELIYDGEIAEVIKIVINHQYATPFDDLIIKTSRLLGIRATTDVTSEKIKNVIKDMLNNKILQAQENGMINLKND